MGVPLDLDVTITPNCFLRPGLGHLASPVVSTDDLQYLQVDEMRGMERFSMGEESLPDARRHRPVEQDLEYSRSINDDHDCCVLRGGPRPAIRSHGRGWLSSAVPATRPSSVVPQTYAFPAAGNRKATFPPRPLSLSAFDATSRAHCESGSSCPCVQHTFMWNACQHVLRMHAVACRSKAQISLL